MKDYDVYKLETAEEIDAAFAATFGLRDPLDWAQRYDQNAVTDFLEGLTGERTILEWSITRRLWGSSPVYIAVVSSVHKKRGTWGKYATTLGTRGTGFDDDFACFALMKAAIGWDQRRRELKREKVAAKRMVRKAAQSLRRRSKPSLSGSACVCAILPASR